jgi:RNA-directed DNA polymerase
VRLAQLAKRTGTTYSRYADDLTFSTGNKNFPAVLAKEKDDGGSQWELGPDLTREIERADFKINVRKVRMQYRTSRQTVTGLTVNSKVNICGDYYRTARSMCHSAMCHSAFSVGSYTVSGETVTSLNPLQGMLSHIYYVKDSADDRDQREKRKEPTAAHALYARFLFFCNFVTSEKPVVLCEGVTDRIYLQIAVRKLTNLHPRLGKMNEGKFASNLSFFRYSKSARDVLGLTGGTGSLKFFILDYTNTKSRWLRLT